MEIKPLTFLFEAYWDISPKMAPCDPCAGTETMYFGISWYSQFRFPDLLLSGSGDGTDQTEISHQLFDGLQWTLLLTPMVFWGRLWKMSFLRRLTAESSCQMLWVPSVLTKTDAFDWCLDWFPHQSHQYLMAWQPNILHIPSLLTEYAQFSFFTSQWKFPSGQWNAISPHLSPVFPHIFMAPRWCIRCLWQFSNLCSYATAETDIYCILLNIYVTNSHSMKSFIMTRMKKQTNTNIIS